MTKHKWAENITPFGSINYWLRSSDDTFGISYNPDPSIPGLSLFDGDGGPETALVLKGTRNSFYVLNGDFRSAYENLINQGFAACKAFYDQQSAHAESSWSDSKRETA